MGATGCEGLCHGSYRGTPEVPLSPSVSGLALAGRVSHRALVLAHGQGFLQLALDCALRVRQLLGLCSEIQLQLVTYMCLPCVGI